MKESFSIGEFAAMFGLNVQTLHYYDSIGLFKPEKRDANTGRRRYTFEQVYQLASIRYMRRLGYSLPDIEGYMARLDADFALEHLKERSRELRRQWEELLAIDQAIQRKISFIELSLEEAQDLGAYAVRTYGERRYLLIGEEDQLYFADTFYFYPTMAFYEGKRKYFGAYLYGGRAGQGTEEAPEASGAKVLPAGRFLCGYHVGPYDKVPKSIQKMRVAYPALQLSETAVNFNIVDQFVERDKKKYITHIQILILE